MDLLFKYNQEKSDKYNSKSICDLKLFYDGTTIIYDSLFDFEYLRYGNKKRVLFHHNLSFNTITGDVVVTYKIINDNLTNDKSYNNKTKTKKNDFNLLFELTENGFIRGEKRIGYWGIKYHRAQYYDIQNDYPKKKWLIKNDYKFLPAVLDSYGIKSRYLIGELNRYEGKPIHISSLNYLCKLFGENYIDYIKKIVWENHCFDLPPNKKTHQLKNESEKDCMVKTINNWETETLRSDTLIYSLNKLFTIRDLLESKKIDLKFKAKNDNEFENHMDTWLGYKLHFARGYKVRYSIPIDVVNELGKDIIINGELYKPNILLTEDDYRVEGYVMKNCMAKQFPHGSIYIFVSLHHGRKKINLQYRKGNLIQSYGKANTAVPDSYDEVIELLTQRMKKYHDIEWKKEKYDFLTY